METLVSEGTLSEVIAKARHAGEEAYIVLCRDGTRRPEVPLQVLSDAKDSHGDPVEILVRRIAEVKRSGVTVWRKGR